MKKFFKNLLLTVLFVSALIMLFVLSGCKIQKGDVMVPIMIADIDGLKVVSENPVSVPVGNDAIFTVEKEEALVFDNLPENVKYEEGKIIVSDVIFPKTLKLKAHKRVLCDFFASVNSDSEGELKTNIDAGKHWSETKVSLTATPKEGFCFLGYSMEYPLNEGGEIVEFNPEYTFSLSENVKIYANFAEGEYDPAMNVEVPEDKWVLIYHSNGGKITETGNAGVKKVEFSNEFYHCPNTILDWDYFERDGYLLYGYNTRPDGSGIYYAPGWNVVMPERGAISLYCMWAKISDASDFQYSVDNGVASISKYIGNDEFVVIPEIIDGNNVEVLKANSFSENTTMRKVFVNKNIRTIEEEAFSNCDALEELYFSDSVTTVADTSFFECANLQKLYMIAVISPHYSTIRNGTYAIKYERLITAPGKKLAISCGSNGAYGINSPLIEETLKKNGYEYSLINYGTNAGTPITFFNEVISYHIKEGDILLIAPEINALQFGYSAFNTTVWQIFEGAYDAFACVDMRNYSKLFSSFTTFNATRDLEAKNSNAYELYSTETVNDQGDYSMLKEGSIKSYENTVNEAIASGGTWDFSTCVGYFNTYGDKLNYTLDLVKEKKGTALFTFAVTNIVAMKEPLRIPGGTAQREYEAKIDELVHATRISEVSDYLLEKEYFFNSHNHPTTVGAEIRSQRLAEDIINYLNNAE